MSGIPVIVVERFGIPVKAVDAGAPVMTVSVNGFGIPIVLSERGAPFVVQGLVPPPEDFWQDFVLIAGDASTGGDFWQSYDMIAEDL